MQTVEDYMEKEHPNKEWYYDLLSNDKRKIVIIPESGFKIYFDSYENEKGQISWSPTDSNGLGL
jgi:hypothetical protein